MENPYHYHWFIHEHNVKLTTFSKLEKIPNYMKNMVEEHPYSILKELQERQHYKQRGRPSFFAKLIHYALPLRYTSKQAYKLLLEKFPLPSFSLFEKIQRGGIESNTAAKWLLEKIIFPMTVLMLQKGTQFHSKEDIGANEDDELFKEVKVFMITDLKNTVPLVLNALS